MVEGQLNNNNKGTSERKKVFKNHLIFGACFSTNIWIKKIPTTSSTHSIEQWAIKNTNFDGETCTTVCQFFWFGSNSKNISFFVELSF